MDILLNQYPILRGFHNTLFGANLSFPITKPPFIQIIHVNNNHWITVKAVTMNFVWVYDSLYNLTDISAQMQIAALIHIPLSQLLNLTYNKHNFKWVHQIVVCFQ